MWYILALGRLDFYLFSLTNNCLRNETMEDGRISLSFDSFEVIQLGAMSQHNLTPSYTVILPGGPDNCSTYMSQLNLLTVSRAMPKEQLECASTFLLLHSFDIFKADICLDFFSLRGHHPPLCFSRVRCAASSFLRWTSSSATWPTTPTGPTLESSSAATAARPSSSSTTWRSTRGSTLARSPSSASTAARGSPTLGLIHHTRQAKSVWWVSLQS